VAGNPELADQVDVERRAQRLGDLERHRHPASRQPQDQHVTAASIFRQLVGQHPASIGAILERQSDRHKAPPEPS
jgi:hypothetical protein